MNRIIYFIIILVFVTGCSNSSSKKKTNDTLKVTFSSLEYKDTVERAGITPTNITASIPIAGGTGETATNINNTVFETIRFFVGQEGDTSSDYNELFSAFVRNHEIFSVDYPDVPGGWDAYIKGTVPYNSSSLVNIKIESYIMTGGAHGNTNVISLIFDTKDGKKLNIDNIVKDTSALIRIAEIKFREKFDIPVGSPINSTGFMFTDDTFVLPQNIFIAKDGLQLLYNRYEIAAYYQGTKEVFIPYDEIKDILSIDILN